MKDKGARLLAISAAIFGAVTFATTGTTHASMILAHWTFEESAPSSAGDHYAEYGERKNTSRVMRFAANSSATYSSPAGNGSSNTFSSTHWSANDYYEFKTNTLGFESITIQWDQTRSNNGPSSFHLQWSVDGINFTTFYDYTVTESWVTHGAVLAPTDLADATTVYFRLTSPNSAPGGHSTSIDNIIIGGTAIPSPGALTLLGLAGLVSVGRRRRS